MSHGYLPCSLESDEKLLEMSRGLGTGGDGASRHRGQQRARGEKARNVVPWFAVCLKTLEKLILHVFLVVDYDSDLKNRC